MLDDNWDDNGPHHLLLPPMPTALFRSKQEEAPWLEISLEKEVFLSGLLLLCHDNDDPPVKASLLAENHPGSGGTKIQAFKSFTVVCFVVYRTTLRGKACRTVKRRRKAVDHLPRWDFLLRH